MPPKPEFQARKAPSLAGPDEMGRKGGGASMHDRNHAADVDGIITMTQSCTFGVGLREEAPLGQLNLFAILLLLSWRRVGGLGRAAC